MRAVEVLERELVQSGKRLFAASLEHVPAAERELERRLDDATTASPGCSSRRSPCSPSARSRAPRRGWLYRAQWETAVPPFMPRAGGGGRVAVEFARAREVLEYERAEARRKRFEAQVEEEMLFEAPRVPRPLSTRPREERRAEAEQRVREREAAA